jgi:hypothetical protein
VSSASALQALLELLVIPAVDMPSVFSPAMDVDMNVNTDVDSAIAMDIDAEIDGKMGKETDRETNAEMDMGREMYMVTETDMDADMNKNVYKVQDHRHVHRGLLFGPKPYSPFTLPRPCQC